VVNTLYFTAVGWTVFIIVWKWSIGAPLIAGKRRKRALAQETSRQQLEGLLEQSYRKIVANIEKATEQRGMVAMQTFADNR
jgi:hypothetical protein